MKALALAFAERHAGDLRYVAEIGKWFTHDGVRWRVDTTKLAFNEARKICREAAAKCSKPKTARALASARTVSAIMALARADRRIAATIDQIEGAIPQSRY
jgi:putative DNA primase/helicase